MMVFVYISWGLVITIGVLTAIHMTDHYKRKKRTTGETTSSRTHA